MFSTFSSILPASISPFGAKDDRDREKPDRELTQSTDDPTPRPPDTEQLAQSADKDQAGKKEKQKKERSPTEVCLGHVLIHESLPNTLTHLLLHIFVCSCSGALLSFANTMKIMPNRRSSLSVHPLLCLTIRSISSSNWSIPQQRIARLRARRQTADPSISRLSPQMKAELH